MDLECPLLPLDRQRHRQVVVVYEVFVRAPAFTVIFTVRSRHISIGAGFRVVLRKLTFRDLSVPEHPASALLHLAVRLG